MYPGNGRRPPHSHSTSGSKATVNQSTTFGWPMRHMGPPPLNYPPQPVEIDPVSYSRAPGYSTPWESTAYSIGSIAESSPSLSSSLGHGRTTAISLDLGTRTSPQDPIANWYNGNDGPWVPKGAVPEAPPDDRFHNRGLSLHRLPGHGSRPGTHHRPGNSSEAGSAHFGVPSSDSGYGTGLESASVRGSDIADHSQDNRSLISRVPEFHQYSQNGPSSDSNGTQQWAYTSPSAPLYRCETCQKPVKTKSELKKHHLRHTKPFTCKNSSCNRKEGFSTVNDLLRHTKSRHPGDIGAEMQSKTYQCLVDGCKSQEKIWPRLDNFRSHLKRMHRLQDDVIDQFVQRGAMDQIKYSLPSQGTSSESPRRMDQEGSLELEPVDFTDLSYHGDHPQWGHESPGSLDRQTEVTEPLENSDEQTLEPPDGGCPVGLEHEPGKPMGLEGSRASWEENAENGCLQGSKKLEPSDPTDEDEATPGSDPLGSSLSKLESADMPERGKTPKLKKTTPIDPCLRDAIIAVISTAKLGKNNGSDPGLPEGGLADGVHASDVSSCQTKAGTALPNPAVTSTGHLNNQDPCLDTPPTSEPGRKDFADKDTYFKQILQAIADNGYTLKKDHKSTAGHGQTLNLGSNISKKRDPVSCPNCKFRGRPCELKKHMRRHTRPYGCTFKCTKTFGSKNDWKRHEITQHYQHEMWKCDEKTNDTSCTKMYFNADMARTHLAKAHKITDANVVERKINGRRIGGNNQYRYWCGFCQKTIDLDERGTDGWTERFNHIDDHFIGRNCQKQQIKEWKAVDDDRGMQHVPRKPLSSDESEGDRESSEDSSPLSTDTPSASQNILTVPKNTGAGVGPRKRKRSSSDERGDRPKQSRHGISEFRIQCCQCGFNLNPRTDTVCPIDNHNFCDGCTRDQFRLVSQDNTQ